MDQYALGNLQIICHFEWKWIVKTLGVILCGNARLLDQNGFYNL